MEMDEEAELAPTEETAPKRGPGRPPGSKNKPKDGEELKPVSLEGDEPPLKKPRGRPKGSSAGKADLEFVEMGLVAIHELLATFVLHDEIWKLDDQEAAKLAERIAAVAEKYKIKLGGKHGVWANLILTCSVIYGQRAMVLLAKSKFEKAQADDGTASAAG